MNWKLNTYPTSEYLNNRIIRSSPNNCGATPDFCHFRHQSQIMRNEGERQRQGGIYYKLLDFFQDHCFAFIFPYPLCFTHIWRAIYFQWHKKTIIYLQGTKGTVNQYQWLNDLEAKKETESVQWIYQNCSQSQRDRTFPWHLGWQENKGEGGSGGRKERAILTKIRFILPSGEIHSRVLLVL